MSVNELDVRDMTINNYSKLLLCLKFVKEVYYKNIADFLNIDEISKKYDKRKVETFNFFLMLVYEFHKNDSTNFNVATYHAFEIMDLIFEDSWKYIFYDMGKSEYLSFLEKYVYSNIIGKNSFFIEFNFKGLKEMYDKYLLSKT